MAERVFRLVGRREDMIEDPRYKDSTHRVQHREEIGEIVGAGGVAGEAG
jgi:hypothetical protein